MNSMTTRRVAAGLAALIAAAGLATAPAALARTSVTDTLTAGHALTADTDHEMLRTRTGEFQLQVENGVVALDQFAPLTGPRGSSSIGRGIWFRESPRGSAGGHDHTQLYLTSTGDLLLWTSRHKILWSSRTRAGAHSRLVLRAGGNVVLYTARGKRVWQTHTTSVYMTAGERLPSGHRLNDRWGDQHGPPQSWSLVMQKNGDLVARCNSSVQWRSRTKVPGSYLVMQTDGNLVIRTPNGRGVWSSHTHGDYVYFNATSVRVVVETWNRTLWHANIRYDAPC